MVEAAEDPASGADLFAGAAPYYARHRLPYPTALIDLIIDSFGLGGESRALDLGTGTGQVALPLAARCAEVVAADISAEMIAEARAAGARAGRENIRWLVLPAEEVSPALGRFRLVTIAQAFHWMDREAVLTRVMPLLGPGGGIALLGMSTIWGAPEPWAQLATAVVRRWLGEERRAGAGSHRDTQASGHRPFEEILADAGFVGVRRGEYRYEHSWDADGIIGYLYSTSYCSPTLLRDRRAAFEAQLRRELLALEPGGAFVQAIEASYFLGWKG